MFTELVFFIGVVVIGGIALITAALYRVFRKNLTMRLWIGLIPGIALVVISTYVLGRFGGITNLPLTFTLFPISITVLVANFFLVGKTMMQRIIRSVVVMNEASSQVAAASNQISTASQQLAEGASEQAAGLEETSASLEEMAAVTKQNADNSSQADSLMQAAGEIVTKANTTMKSLTRSMAETHAASEETSKIIKTIDEIAFQTNLLALNAAVEAARAGEAGAGFAVVADEVRNLALRAADAARNTSDLIEGTVKTIGTGATLVNETNVTFEEIVASTSRVAGIITEIASASNEQAQGIAQVSIAVAEMDKVVQANAASAEESAGASEEMRAQAEQMNKSVSELGTLVGGNHHTLERTHTEFPGELKRIRALSVPDWSTPN